MVFSDRFSLACCSEVYRKTHTHAHVDPNISICLFLQEKCLLSLQSQASYLFRPHFLPRALLLRNSANPLWRWMFSISNVYVLCVCVHSQEWKRGEANGLAYAAQRQLPRERRPQGESKARSHTHPDGVTSSSLAFTAPQGSH